MKQGRSVVPSENINPKSVGKALMSLIGAK